MRKCLFFSGRTFWNGIDETHRKVVLIEFSGHIP